jgi:hypothetical protein
MSEEKMTEEKKITDEKKLYEEKKVADHFIAGFYEFMVKTNTEKITKEIMEGLFEDSNDSCRRFETGGSLDRRVNCRRVPQPRWVGARRSAKGGRSRRETGVKGETCGLRVCLAPGRVRLQ